MLSAVTCKNRNMHIERNLCYSIDVQITMTK